MVSQKSRDTFFSLRKNTPSISHQKKQPKITFFLKRSCEQFSKYSAFSLCAKTLPNNRDKFRGFFNHPADDLTFFMRDLHFADLHASSISQARFVQFRSEHSAQRLVDIYLLHDRSNPFRMKGALLYCNSAQANLSIGQAGRHWEYTAESGFSLPANADS